MCQNNQYYNTMVSLCLDTCTTTCTEYGEFQNPETCECSVVTPSAPAELTYTVITAFDSTEDRMQLSHGQSYSLVDITTDLYEIETLTVLDDGIWKNLMVHPFL